MPTMLFIMLERKPLRRQGLTNSATVEDRVFGRRYPTERTKPRRLRRFIQNAGAFAAITVAVPGAAHAPPASATHSEARPSGITLMADTTQLHSGRDISHQTVGTSTIQKGPTERVDRKGQSIWEVAKRMLRQAQVKRTTANVDRIVHTIDGLNPSQDPDHPKGKRLTVYIPSVDRAITIVATTKLLSDSPSEIVSAKRAIDRTTHYEAGTTLEDPGVRHNDSRLVAKIGRVIRRSQIPLSPTQVALHDMGIDSSDLVTTHMVRSPATGHHSGNKHRHHEHHKLRDDVSKFKRVIKKGLQNGVFHRTKLRSPNPWDQEQRTTVPGVKLSNAETNPINRVTRVINIGRNFTTMHRNTKYNEPTQNAELLLALGGDISAHQLRQLHRQGEISNADYRALKAINKLDHQSNSTSKAKLTEAGRNAANATIRLMKEHGALISQYKEKIIFSLRHPDKPKDMKRTLATILAPAMAHQPGPPSSPHKHTSEPPSSRKSSPSPTPSPTHSHKPETGAKAEKEIAHKAFTKGFEEGAEVAGGVAVFLALIAGGILLTRRRRRSRRETVERSKRIKETRLKNLIDTDLYSPATVASLVTAQEKDKIRVTTPRNPYPYLDEQVRESTHPQNDTERAVLLAIKRRLLTLQNNQAEFMTTRQNAVIGTTDDFDKDIVERIRAAFGASRPGNDVDEAIRSLRDTSADPYIRGNENQDAVDKLLGSLGITIQRKPPVRPAARPAPGRPRTPPPTARRRGRTLSEFWRERPWRRGRRT